MKAPGRGDLIWLEFSPQAGHEQSGRRPALVVSPKSYNAAVGLMLCCPITSKSKGFPFEVPLPGGAAINGVVLADQIKSMDWRARKTRHAGTVPSSVSDQVLAKTSTLLK